jgi:hypothetical protein
MWKTNHSQASTNYTLYFLKRKVFFKFKYSNGSDSFYNLLLLQHFIFSPKIKISYNF